MSAPTHFRRPIVFATILLFAAAASAFLAWLKPFQAASTPYLVGDTAREDVIAPSEVVVIDPEATEQRRQAEAAKIPAVFRFQKETSAQAVARFSTDFIFTRESFLDAIEKNFKSRTLSTEQLDLPRFRRMWNTFQTGNKSYPVTLQEARAWAQGDSGEKQLREATSKLRQATDRLIREEALVMTNLPLQVRIYSGSDLSPSLAALRQESEILRRTNLVAPARVRSDLLAAFNKEQRPLGRFLTNYVQPNCTLDAELTRLIRADKTNALWQVATFAPGQQVVRRGDVIDAKTQAALEELNVQKPSSRSAAAFNHSEGLWWASAVCAALAVAFLVVAVRRNRPAPANNVLVLPNPDFDEAHPTPHLVRALMNKFVRALISQRSDLMRTQKTGSDQLADLEERLDQINSRLKTRQSVYEKRIAELERELAAAEEENRELIRAKIHEARQNLEWAKAQATGK